MAENLNVEVRTDRGRVSGRIESVGDRLVAVFRGIPYAEPPFGALRFAAPEPAGAWDGVRPAVDFGPPVPSCDRMNPANSPAGTADPAPDCLTVNVWSPEVGATGLPVMVWFHGGSYVFGHAGDPVYDGGPMAAEGVVMVTFNYRVGMEGFGYLAGAPANRGLLDQVAALRWVRRNIAKFGGDPERVTVFGESAGAGSIAALLASEQVAGLLRRAVLQSVPGLYFTPALGADVAAVVAARLGLPATAEALRAADPAELVRAGEEAFAKRAEQADRWGVLAHAETVLAPVVDGSLPARTPWEALARGAASGVDVMLGWNREEYRLFMAKRGEFGTVDAALATRALSVFGRSAGGERAYREAYPGLGAEELYERVCSDWMCRVPTLDLLEARAQADGRTFGYELRWPAPVAGGALGACHGLDVPLVLGTLDSPVARQLLGPEPGPETRELSRRMRGAWVRFADTGDPGWPAYGVRDRRTKVFDRSDGLAVDPLRASREMWKGSVFGVLDLAPGV
ncbi:carboxylesterase/lipase family protein [Streptomyces sp. NA04227]|uniref:carboxylesterase/lipase family protein n=1 Tax=Streptomyces sp. NA04227 TaxID=2742136 RepID=UPI0015925DFF|nr:carboxylesterase family protein [Streptomyces sp. NA04227]QKW07756.1 carboxylesterase/lipase family protein [Streptomyces sp. NA04227]